MNSTAFDAVRKEVMEAYADCWDYKDESDWDDVSARRNLHFKASSYLSRDEAVKIMKEAVPGYNVFEPELLELLPEDCEVLIAREGSVCVYVKGSIPPDTNR